MNKTPYELRFDILQMARNHLMQMFEANYDWTKNMVDHSASTADQMKLILNEVKSMYPSFEDIQSLADKMNAFVSKN